MITDSTIKGIILALLEAYGDREWRQPRKHFLRWEIVNSLKFGGQSEG